MYKKLILILAVISISLTGSVPSHADLPPGLDPVHFQINAVRFDPSYYYDSPLTIEEMTDQLAAKWKKHGVSTVFFKAYDPIYGAKYKTSYDLNMTADYGRQDLLKHIIASCSENGIQVFAWLTAFQHRSAWQRHPGWRVKTADGSDYAPTNDSYFLCPAHPDVRRWWLGFIRDILEHYPELAGIDIAEPIIGWETGQCYCGYHAGEGGPNAASQGLTETLGAAVKLIHELGRKACVTTVASAHPDGRVYSAAEQMRRTGFDLQGVLEAAHPPDWISVELMWQQWADLFQNDSVFTPEWTRQAARTIVRQVNGRATLIGHLELTSFGDQKVDVDQLSASILEAKAAGIEHVDLYDTHLLDTENAWGELRASLLHVDTKEVLICTDSIGLNDARQVASLVSHFNANVQLIQFRGDQVPPDSLERFDVVFVVGVDPEAAMPRQFLKELGRYDGTICWLHYGVDQFLNIAGQEHYGFEYHGAQHDSSYRTVAYNGYSLPRLDPDFNRVAVTDSAICRSLASVTNGGESLPYVLRSGYFWYLADLPTAFVTEGGRHIVFCDLLHDIMREDHQVRKPALVRIEDINPLSDVESLRRISKYLSSQKVPFSIALVPFYLDPESNTAVSLSDRPELVEALHDAVRSGGTIIMHGSTHQYRGETTADYEFWDTMIQGPLFSDSREYVRQRLMTGLAELRKNKIYPLMWETPHYGASQLDYDIINTFFSTAYERRQTIDLHGSDQLVPYLIRRHTAGGKIIPENLGYIPLTQPEAGSMLAAARNNLALRDGFASFFFHPFVDHTPLEDLVSGLKQLGYEFTTPRLTSNSVRSPDYAALSGEGEIELELHDDFFHEFYIDQKGHVRDESYSDSPIVGKISKRLTVPAGWMYVAERATQKPKNILARALDSILPSAPKLTSAIAGVDKPLQDAEVIPLKPIVLLNGGAEGAAAKSQTNFVQALGCVGVDVDTLEVSEFLEVPDHVNLMIIPQAAAVALSQQQNLFLIHALQAGLNMIFEKNSALTENIGIYSLEREVVVRNVVDEYYPQVGITWVQPDSLRQFDIDLEYVSYYSDKDSQLPIVVGGEYGQGKYLYFGTLFDPHTDGGYGRFPYFIDLLKRQFSLVPTIRRNSVEVYFEPGDREDTSVEDLIKVWRNNGVRRIYVSAWHFYEEYTYDYERLIDLAHQNAMLVYAWLELPHVNQKFWDDHVEWREKTATGRDALVDWRRNMALNKEDCRQAVFHELRAALTNYDWDGVNLAELYYESPLGYGTPDDFTPMNDEIRSTFSRLEGFDPQLLFDPLSEYHWKRNPAAAAAFNQFREDQIVELHRHFLEYLYQLKRDYKLDYEIIVTTVDHLLSPEVGEATAINTLRLAELEREFPFTLQIEDPQALWPLGPDRYTKILEAYAEVQTRMPLVLDINVVPYRDMNQSQAPTMQPSGLELFQLANAAGQEQTRVAFYSEASLYEVDFPMLPFVMAADAVEEITDDSWTVEAPYTVNLLIDAQAHSDVLVDGRIWPACYRGRVLLPAGKHTLRSVSKIKSLTNWFRSTTRLVDLSGELLSASVIARGIRFEYQSIAHNIVLLTEMPQEIFIDDQPVDPQITTSELGFAVRLPSGRHVATIYTQTSGNQFTKHASVLLSGAIVLIGASAGMSLSFIYAKNSLRRKRRSPRPSSN
ncbi:DUF2334 domain-containing protein [Candidatus Zixiibacteriota bacterium]